MAKNIFKSPQYAAFFAETLAEGLRPLWKVYFELRSRAQPGAAKVMIVPDILASELGCTVDRLQATIKDLSMLDAIYYTPKSNTHEECEITFLVM